MDVKRNNPFSLEAFETVYNKCENLLEQFIEHIGGNMQYVEKDFSE